MGTAFCNYEKDRVIQSVSLKAGGSTAQWATLSTAMQYRYRSVYDAQSSDGKRPVLLLLLLLLFD
jgi:hypothetical protein